MVNSMQYAWFLSCIGIAEILKPSCHVILQEMDKEKTNIIESKWTVDNEMVWTERGVGKLLSTIPDISGENSGRIVDFYKGRDRR